MQQSKVINLNELLVAISDVLDLASEVLMKHQQRTTYIAWQMGVEAGLSAENLDHLFVASILHDIGALSVEEKVSIHSLEAMETKNHCVVGYRQYNRISWLKSSADIVLHHHTLVEEYDGGVDSDTMLCSQILLLADMVERHIDKDTFVLHQKKSIRGKIAQISPDIVPPAIIDYFLKVSGADAFWLDLMAPDLGDILLGFSANRSLFLSMDEIKDVALVIKDIIDYRTHFTANHSTGVAACARELSKLYGFSKEEILKMEVAGYLHDVGKLSVPNSILEKKGKLDPEESNIIRQHAYETYSVLSGIKGLEDIAAWAGMHHERADGSGYPFGIEGDQLQLGARLFAIADVFTALSEDRPYRNAMTFEQIKAIMEGMADAGKLDSSMVSFLFEHMDHIYEAVIKERRGNEKQYKELTSGDGDA